MALPEKARPRHKAEGNPKVKCNAQYTANDNWNCKLKANEAIQLARHLLKKAQLLVEEGLDDFSVHLWSTGSDTLYCGIDKARIGPGRKPSTKSS
ncbi:MAG: hypothetical protein WDZ48_00360 [Pirellulales bacterium]